MVYQSEHKKEIERIQSLLSTIAGFCEKDPINAADYQPTESLQYVVKSWIKDATANNVELFSSLSPTVRGLIGTALQKELQNKLHQLTLTHSF